MWTRRILYLFHLDTMALVESGLGSHVILMFGEVQLGEVTDEVDVGIVWWGLDWILNDRRSGNW